jgi:hypothetical protein
MAHSVGIASHFLVPERQGQLQSDKGMGQRIKGESMQYRVIPDKGMAILPSAEYWHGNALLCIAVAW